MLRPALTFHLPMCRSKNIDDADTFTFNAGFKHPKRMVVIHTPSLDERRRKIREAVDEDRLYVVDAAVVRVMKARRTMSHVVRSARLLAMRVCVPLTGWRLTATGPHHGNSERHSLVRCGASHDQEANRNPDRQAVPCQA